jgi:hypothetical protein
MFDGRCAARTGCTTASLALVALALGATELSPTEYQVKAAFILHYARLVTWPPSPAEQSSEPFDVAVVGRDPFGDALETTLGSSRVHGRPIRIRRAATVADLPALPQILFVGEGYARAIRQALEAVQGRPVLTVGDSERFVALGGMIGFRVTADERVAFDVNLARAEEAGLRLSSQLLRVARVVETKP